MAKKQAYGNESITTLKGADRVRKRPAVISLPILYFTVFRPDRKRKTARKEKDKP